MLMLCESERVVDYEITTKYPLFVTRTFDHFDKCLILGEYHFVVVSIVTLGMTYPELSETRRNLHVWTEILQSHNDNP